MRRLPRRWAAPGRRGVSHRSEAEPVAVGRAGRSHRSWSDLQLYARLLGEARRYWLHIVALFLLGLVSTGTALLTPLPLKIAVDNGVGLLLRPQLVDPESDASGESVNL